MAAYPDISHWKPVQNWSTVKKNCPFLISKATQGTGYVDPTLNSFIKNCEANKIPYWLYTFLNKGSELAQAKYMVSVCKPKVGKFFQGYVLDIESGNSAAGVKSALDYLKKQSAKTMIYTMYAQYSIYAGVIASRGSNCAWWEARYGANTGSYNSAYPCHTGVDLHQYTSNGSVPGIGNTVDLNRVAGKKKLEWFTGASTKTENKTKKTKKSSLPSGTTLQLVAKVMQGKYGSGEERKKKLGDKYEDVQKMINHISKASTAVLVKETLKGKYGNGATRKAVLGGRYKSVQAAINK